MKTVYFNVSYDLFETLPNFFRKLRRFVGEYRIEQTNMTPTKTLSITFQTDKFSFAEGEDRCVFIEAKSNKRGSWYFTTINKRLK